MSDPTREEALAHFGVKGMHWGTRKSSAGTTHTPMTVRKPSTRGATFKKHAVTAGLVVSYIGVVLASEAATRGVGSIRTSPQADKGKQFAIANPDLMKAKKSRGGVYKVTTL